MRNISDPIMKKYKLTIVGVKMRKTLLLVLGFLLCTVTFILPQTATLKTHGADPDDVAANTSIFTRRYNGLQNVGIQTQMYLEGQLTGATLNSPTWTIVQSPANSNASFGNYTDLNDSTRVITFTPDIAGVYVVQFAQGNASAQLKIHASTYWGVYPKVGGCGTSEYCHSAIRNEWTQTGHYKIFEEGLDGTLSNHYGPSCIECHTTGYDTSAANGGFDDWPFVFPDTLMPGMFDSMEVAYPQAMVFARIQCESCHGPGADHFSDTTDFKIQKTLNYEDCSYCHNEGTHHYFPTQWKASIHAQIPHGQTRAGCYCHNGQLFVEYMKAGKQPPTTDASDKVPISCAVCHDPHSVANPHQVRTMTATLENGVEISDVGTGAICMNCHHAREEAVSYTNDFKNNLAHYGPHHGPQADMLKGTNAITFGQDIPSSPHLYATSNACVTCHMFPEGADSLGNIILMGSHTFSMTDQNGNDNVAACAPCHGNIGTEFSDKKFYVNGNADLDGDGVANGLQIEVQGLLDTLAVRLPPLGSTDVVVDSNYTLTQAQAAYDYLMVKEDRSLGIHNPEYTYGILSASLNALGYVLAVENGKNNTPHDFALSQNYPNPFNPTTKINFSLPKNSHVTLNVYNIAGQLVKQLVNRDMGLGVHTVDFDASKLASGIYLYRIVTPEFNMTKKMVLLK